MENRYSSGRRAADSFCLGLPVSPAALDTVYKTSLSHSCSVLHDTYRKLGAPFGFHPSPTSGASLQHHEQDDEEKE